jgi:hypothetical protein
VRLYFSLLRDYLGRALLVALIVLVVSTSGYILLAQYSWLDALFMTFVGGFRGESGQFKEEEIDR